MRILKRNCMMKYIMSMADIMEGELDVAARLPFTNFHKICIRCADPMWSFF